MILKIRMKRIGSVDHFDLCIAWNWEYDADFVKLLDAACQSRGLVLSQITSENLVEMMRGLFDKEVTLHTFFDRASGTDPRFGPLVQWACADTIHHINDHERASLAWDKGAMHRVISRTMQTPSTLILPSYDEQPLLPPIDLGSLGPSFTIKPCYGGGGDGVVNEATTVEQVVTARQEFRSERYLLQAQIIPAKLDSQPAWFRVLYCTGTVYLCWWDSSTHVYTSVTSDQENDYNLRPLRGLASSIARICGLDLFSTEIALTPDGRFVIVDYVNDPVDLRLQSKTRDGVPDKIVGDIAGRLAEFVAGSCRPLKSHEGGIPLSYSEALPVIRRNNL